jgi:hypothetical protein
MPTKIRTETRYKLIILVCLLALIPVANMLNKAPTVVPVVQYDTSDIFSHDAYSYFLTINQPEDTCPSVYGHDWLLDIPLSNAYVKMRALVSGLRHFHYRGDYDVMKSHSERSPGILLEAEFSKSFRLLKKYGCV